jgi:dihydroorotate dehydrogenase
MKEAAPASGLYERLVRPLLFQLEPETAHHLAIGALRCASRFPSMLALLRALAGSATTAGRSQTLFGVSFPNPVGLAAGFDKNGVALPAWEALGFGFVEIGTVTARPQPGNPRPRIFRFPDEQALINRLGFNNDGAEVVAERLRRLRASGRWPSIPVGINIGKSKATPIEHAADDYLYSFRQLAPLADYVALNVSSPNTPGLRSLQEHDALSHLLRVIHEENQIARKPVLLKISPDLSAEELPRIVDACEANELAGIIATNTTLDHGSIATTRDEQGGLSGAPLREKSTEFVRVLASRTRLPVIAVGGIFNAAGAREKFDAGARLVQVYTGYIYRGPNLVREINGELVLNKKAAL